ncbi:hypothetical protein V6N11_084241 [Hibiscus sabdariffa]|uniref:Uncharacterized protein n=1 Tax=Hibiscus sabdariffa TaxID=183260 RepID=A0ABR2QSB6_9ROSI
MKMKIANAFYVEPDEIVGGLALWWSNDVKLSIVHYDKNFIDTKISIKGETDCPKEKYGGNPFDHNSAKWYYEFVNQTYLMEIPSSRGSFMWSNQRCNEEAILEKLDRVLSSLE